MDGKYLFDPEFISLDPQYRGVISSHGNLDGCVRGPFVSGEANIQQAQPVKEAYTMQQANDKQVGGTHYKSKIQHWDYVLANEIPYLEAQIIKYLTRWRRKGGSVDLQKAKHFLEKLFESEGIPWVNVADALGTTVGSSAAGAGGPMVAGQTNQSATGLRFRDLT